MLISTLFPICAGALRGDGVFDDEAVREAEPDAGPV
jgi:hypothetical protein